MSDLISREALLQEFNQTAIEWLQDGTYQLQFAAGVMCEVMEMVTKAPTVDAVEIVRCRYCIHHTNEEPEVVYCPAVMGDWVGNDFFCAEGECKGGE